MYFTNRSKRLNYPNIFIEGKEIKNVDEFTYLGLTLDSDLNFKKHVKKLRNKLKFNIANFRYIRGSLTTEASHLYLHSMIFSHFMYCMTSWSQGCKTALRPLESVYKQALKIHDKKSRKHHHCAIFKKYDVLKFENLIFYNNVCFLFKIIHNIAAPPLRQFITLCSDRMTRTTRSTVRGECSLPKCRTAFARSAFSVISMSQWNTLPSEIIATTTFKIFARLTKTWLLGKQTCSHF